MKDVSCSWESETRCYVDHFVLQDPSMMVEAIFTSSDLRRIVSEVVSHEEFAATDNYVDLLTSIPGNDYEILLEVGDRSYVANRCDLVVVKLFKV
ncbi:unnamed protein product [Linum trigynum]|uniref:Uncharacterized protein n=1 Tax=Linum trigynum TaxID=586398 RepID=A0AAV2GPB7_9ROSI